MDKIIIACIITLLLLTAYILGHQEGQRHAIEDSIIWTVDCYNPDDPDASAWNGYDQLIYIELDDQLYQHGMFQS